SCQVADKVIAISEQTKKDIIEFLAIDPAKIAVIPPSYNPIFEKKLSVNEKKVIKQKYTLPDNFLLSVATVEERKNLMSIVNSMLEVDKNIHLVVVGKHTNYALKVKKMISELGLRDRVKFIEKIDFEDLPGIYQLANLF